MKAFYLLEIPTEGKDRKWANTRQCRARHYGKSNDLHF